MLRVSFTDFRCFQEISDIEIRPLTFLVGENSTGKTTFLAGLRFLLEAFGRRSRSPFNRDPYFLGGFEQIVYGGARTKKKALNFRLKLQVDEPSSNERKGIEEIRGLYPVSHEFVFVKGSPQPEISSYYFNCGLGTLSCSFTERDPRVTFQALGQSESRTINLRRSTPSSLLREDSSFIRFMMEEFRVRSKSRQNGARSADVREGLEDNEDSALDERFWEVYSDSSRVLSKELFASAPVRTQPERTYTPSELTSSSEGAHVPLALAQTKLTSLDRWKAIRSDLAEFGKNSGLFTDIDVKRLGKNDIDPFQILVKVGGRMSNLVDVGYGTSQVLPMLYQLLTSARESIFLLQQPEVHLHPRAQAEFGTLLAKVASSHSGVSIVETHSDYIIDRVRIEISRGNINPENVTVIFIDKSKNLSTCQNLFFNSKGDYVNVPKGFRSFFLKEHSDFLGL